jgi:AcrR family transcriptional regulator
MRRIESRVQDPELVQRRREQIADAALEVFSERGYHKTTIREVAGRASIAVGSVYDYIGQKEDLLELIYSRTMREAVARMRESFANAQDPADALSRLIRANLEVVAEHHDFFLLMYQESASMTPPALAEVLREENDYVGLYRACLRQGVERGTFRDVDIHRHAVLLAFMCSIQTLKGWNLRGVTVEQEHEDIATLAMHGLIA